MADFTLVDPRGWEYDLHSVYSAYIGYFQVYNIQWYDRSWGHLFSSFEEFLAFSWPVITVTDARTGRAHIVTRLTSIGAFVKMIKTRFGETLPQAPNMLMVTPFETTTRHLRKVSDLATYKKLHSTLPAAVLSSLKSRVKAGEPKAIRELWDKRDKTFLAIDFEWSERNEKSCLEWGYTAVRCGHLEAFNHWPPVPDTNYRKGHYIVEEYVDKVINKYRPNFPWQYAFGDSQVISKSKLPQIIQAIISSFASPDSETTPNALVLVGHGIHNDIARLEEMKIRLPHNMLVIDTSIYERALYAAGQRGVMKDPRTGEQRQQGSSLSLENFLLSFTIPFQSSLPPIFTTAGDAQCMRRHNPIVLPQCTLHNSGNDAFMCLFGFQLLLEPEGTQTPTIKKTKPGMINGWPSPQPLLMTASMPSPLSNTMPLRYSPNPPQMIRSHSAYDLSGEFGQMHLRTAKMHSNSPYLTLPSTPMGKTSRFGNGHAAGVGLK